MRKIEQQMNQAIRACKNWCSGNTQVVSDAESSKVYLHGNHIATVGSDYCMLYDGGWRSNTTKSRLNALLEAFGDIGSKVYQKDFQWYVWEPQQQKGYDFFNGYSFS